MTFSTISASLIAAASLSLCGEAALATTSPQATTVAEQAKKVVRTQDDLPRYSYPVKTTALELLRSDDATFIPWAEKVGADADATLRDYQIDDPATKRSLLKTRMIVQLLKNDNDGALETSAAIRVLEQKPEARLTSGLMEDSVAKARKESGATSGTAFEAAFARAYRTALAPMPFAVVGTALKEDKGGIEILTPALLEGIVEQDYEPQVKAGHTLDTKGANFLLRARVANVTFLPLKSQAIAALGDFIKANSITKPNIWAARDVQLTQADKLTPVTVAVWDTGVDTSLFKDRLYRPKAKPARGPGNGHGISFDYDSRPVPGVLAPLDAKRRAAYPDFISVAQGASDLQASIESPEAAAMRTKMAGMSTTEMPGFIDNLDFFSNYVHGTHVAGILMRGNPAARLSVIRAEFYGGPLPPPPTDASISHEVAYYTDVGDWIKANKVRVVNMSWILTPREYEGLLEKHKVGKSVTERKAMARRFFERTRTAFNKVLAQNPNTLFVSAAGNSNANNEFEEGFPSAIKAPNLLVASAVDQAGDETNFTSYGRNVLVSANGHRVISTIPGGAELAESGTSMASPNVANLAAKLIALKPSLTPEQTITLIRAGATASEGGRRHNINPKASVELLKAAR